MDPAPQLTLDALKLRLAAQLAPLRWQPHLLRLSERVASEGLLREPFEALSGSMPIELRSLISASLAAPDPAQIIIDAARVRQSVAQTNSQIVRMLLYPMTLLVVALVVACVFSSLMVHLLSFEFDSWWGSSSIDQADANVHDQYSATLGLTIFVIWSLLTSLTIYLVAPPWGWLGIISGLPGLGKIYGWLAVREMLARHEQFAKQGMEGVPASQLTAESFQGSSYCLAAQSILNRIQQGLPLSEAFARSLYADSFLRPGLLLLDESDVTKPTEGFTAVGQLLSQLAQHRLRILQVILPFFVILLVGTLIFSIMATYFHSVWRFIQPLT